MCFSRYLLSFLRLINESKQNIDNLPGEDKTVSQANKFLFSLIAAAAFKLCWSYRIAISLTSTIIKVELRYKQTPNYEQQQLSFLRSRETRQRHQSNTSSSCAVSRFALQLDNSSCVLVLLLVLWSVSVAVKIPSR